MAGSSLAMTWGAKVGFSGGWYYHLQRVGIPGNSRAMYGFSEPGLFGNQLAGTFVSVPLERRPAGTRHRTFGHAWTKPGFLELRFTPLG